MLKPNIIVYLSNGRYRIIKVIVTNNFKKKKYVKIKLAINYKLWYDGGYS